MPEKRKFLSAVRFVGLFAGIMTITLLLVIMPEYLRAETKAESDTLRLGIFPYKSPKSLIELYHPLATRLEKRLGKKIQMVSSSDASLYVEQVTRGGYDIIILPPTVYLKVRGIGFNVIARGTPGFYGCVIVRKGSGITSVSQLQGKKIVATGNYSSAYIALENHLAEQGVVADHKTGFQFVGKADTIVYGVLSKKYEAGMVRLDTLDSPAMSDIRDQFTVLLRSSEIPQYPIAVKSNVDEKTVAAIRQTFTDLSPAVPAESQILQSLQIEKIVAANDADYQEFYELIKDSSYFHQP